MEPRGLLSLTAVLLVALLGPPRALSALTPRVSFPMGVTGRTLTRFSSAGVSNTTTLLLSDDGDTLYVGARDAVLSLDISQQDALLVRNKLDWSPSEKDLEQCSMKGKKKMDCPNFIRVLQFINSTHLYACGTFAFSPRCTYITTEMMSGLTPEEGRGRCPYDPYQRNTAITVDGELYTGTVADYRGNRPVISRHLSVGSHVDLKLDDTLGWLEDPTFISSSFIPSEEKVYFFFSEVGREYDFIDKFTVSRIAQICTSDVGGQRTLQRRWTTFAKAQLLCQSDNELPYNVIEDVVTLLPPEGAPVHDTMFYGIFRSQWSVNSGRSAVCAFSLSDIRAVFSGNYKVLNRDTLRWSSRVQEKIANPGECGLHNASDNTLRFVKENFLADESVWPVGRSLTMVSPDQSYSHLAAQWVHAANGRDYTVLFLLTEAGFLHKAVLLENGPHIIEEIQVFKQPQSVKNLQLSIAKGMVFVGTAEGVVRVPVANCSFYWSCAQCVLARDPFCGWDPDTDSCVEAATFKLNVGQDVDNANIEEVCNRLGPHRLPTGELVSVSLNEVVRLRCPEASRLARRHWQRPDSRLSADVYLQPEDGSLRFIATPATMGHYLCLSTENGYRQTLVVYQVKQKSSPPPPQTTAAPARPHTQPPVPSTRPAAGAPGRGPGPPTFAGVWPTRTQTRPGESDPTAEPSGRPAVATTRPAGRNLTKAWRDPSGPREVELRGAHDLASGHRGAPQYLQELVVVSVLLALCLSLLITLALYGLRQRCRSRTAPQANTPSRDSERGSVAEQEALRGGPVAHGNSKHKGPAINSGQPNGVMRNGTLKTSNGHLPNTPI